MNRPDVLERLASIEHDQWIAWSKSIAYSEQISAERLARWSRLWVPYAELKESEKMRDREWARRALEIVEVIPV